jgi:hypothetical protein
MYSMSASGSDVYSRTSAGSPRNPSTYAILRLSTGNAPRFLVGSCRVFIATSCSLKGKVKNSQDINANIPSTYENSVLTNRPLWNPQTRQFPCGALSPGVNDIPDQSYFDVRKGLNGNANGCSFS